MLVAEGWLVRQGDQMVIWMQVLHTKTRVLVLLIHQGCEALIPFAPPLKTFLESLPQWQRIGEKTLIRLQVAVLHLAINLTIKVEGARRTLQQHLKIFTVPHGYPDSCLIALFRLGMRRDLDRGIIRFEQADKFFMGSQLARGFCSSQLFPQLQERGDVGAVEAFAGE